MQRIIDAVVERFFPGTFYFLHERKNNQHDDFFFQLQE